MEKVSDAGGGSGKPSGKGKEHAVPSRGHIPGQHQRGKTPEPDLPSFIEAFPLPVFVLNEVAEITSGNAMASDLLDTLGSARTLKDFRQLLEPEATHQSANILHQLQQRVLRSATLSLRLIDAKGDRHPCQMHFNAITHGDALAIMAVPIFTPHPEIRACRFPGATGCLADSLYPWMCIFSENLEIQYSNSSIQRLAGVRPAEMMRDRSTLAGMLSSENLDRLRSSVQVVALGNEPCQFIMPVAHRAGGEMNYLWFLTPLFSGADSATQVLALVSDLSAGMVAMRPAPGSPETILEQLPMGYVALDGAGRVMRTNHHLLHALQLGREDVIGRYFGDFLGENDQKEFIRRFGAWLNEGSMRNVVFTLLRADGVALTMKMEGKVAEETPGGQLNLHCVMMGISPHAPDSGAAMRMAEGGSARPQMRQDALNSLSGNISIMCDSYVMRAGLQRIFEAAGTSPRFSGLGASQMDELLAAEPRIVVAAFTSIGEAESRQIREFVERCSAVPLLIVCITIARPLEQEIIKMGVRGLITTENEFSILPTAVLSILEGELWCPRSIMQQVLEQYRSQGFRPIVSGEDDSPLTRREIEVLRLVAKAYKNKEIAEKLGVGYNTIVTHVYNIFRKINVKSRLEAMNYAMSRNLL